MQKQPELGALTETEALAETVEFLKEFQRWRRNDDDEEIPMPSPALIGMHLDIAIKRLEALL